MKKAIIRQNSYFGIKIASCKLVEQLFCGIGGR